MTAISTAHAAPRFRGKSLGTARLHLTNLRTGLIVPLSILAVILVGNVTVWAIVLSHASAQDRADAQQGMQWSGAAFYFVAYMIVFGVQAVGITFPFALGWGVSRRDFYAGTLLAILVRAVFFGALFTILSEIETVTGGWFYGGRMFTAIYFPSGEWYVRLLGFVALFTFAMVIGSAVATVWVRWRGLGMLVLWGAIALILLVAIAATTVWGDWTVVGDGLEGLFALPQAVLWALALIPSVVLAALGYLVLRRAAPRG